MGRYHAARFRHLDSDDGSLVADDLNSGRHWRDGSVGNHGAETDDILMLVVYARGGAVVFDAHIQYASIGVGQRDHSFHQIAVGKLFQIALELHG